MADGVIYVGSRDGGFLALDGASATGEIIWATDLTEVLSSAAITEERIYVGSSDGNLHVLDRQSGQSLHQLPVGDLVWTSPVVVDDHLFFGAHDGNIHAYNLTRVI